MKIGSFETDNDGTFIIAELSANHNGDLNIAIESVKAAKRAGANAIKLQTYTPDTITLKCSKKDFTINSNTIWDGRNLYDLYQEAYTPWEWHESIFKAAREEGLICFSSPFDFSAVDFLEELNVPAYKIASFEITDIPLIEYTASKGKPIIISTGVASLEDIELALSACRKVNNNQIALLKCTSSYPAPLEEANLKMIQEFKERFKVEVGLSDHTLGTTAPIVAVAFGARIIEKHFILDKNLGGPDSSFSLDEKEFKTMVLAVREAEKSIGKVSFQLTPKQISGRDFCRSLYVCKDLNKGEVITSEHIKSVRPGFGLHPSKLNDAIGSKAYKNFKYGDRLELE